MNKSARRFIIRTPCERLANGPFGEHPFGELFSSYKRKSFSVTLAHNFFLAPKIITFFRKFVSQNKAKNAGRSRKNAGMREINQNAGFPARLRDG